MSGYAFELEVPQPPEAELAVSGQPRLALVRDRRLAKADPAEQPLHEPVPLAQLPQRGERARRQQAEVAGVGGDRRLRQPLHDPVENVRGGLLRSEEPTSELQSLMRISY